MFEKAKNEYREFSFSEKILFWVILISMVVFFSGLFLDIVLMEIWGLTIGFSLSILKGSYIILKGVKRRVDSRWSEYDGLR